MSVIPALDTKRTLAEMRLPDSCVIYAVSGSNSTKGTKKTYAPRADQPIPCRFATLSGRELVMAQQLRVEADCKVSVAHDTTVKTKDRIVVTKAETGDTFDVEISHINVRSEEIQRVVWGVDITPSEL